ncbi:MAG TPA: NIPSNAP family protein [Vicinamibacterales bacterium]|nr:NIPSNAP family protein [Vicinamibacterales bacterium]
MSVFSLSRIASAIALLGIGFAFGSWNAAAVAHAQNANRVYELRTYTAPEGKLPDLQARFRNHTMRIFERHGMKNVGYWVPQDAPAKDNTLIYIISHESREAAKKSWAAFAADPEWQKVNKESNANGKILAGVVSVYMDPTDYSPIK